jgi:hypothetical protein
MMHDANQSAVPREKLKQKPKPLQRSLTPHIDCCPMNMYESGKEFPRWRPIQCITALTDNIDPDTGGFEAVPGFHKEFRAYFDQKEKRGERSMRVMELEESRVQESLASSDRTQAQRRPVVCLGDFSPLRTQEDKEVIRRYRHIPCSGGSVILFDWRIPHANSYRHVGSIPREVIYTGFLPPITINRKYAQEQLRRYYARLLPTDHWQKNGKHYGANHENNGLNAQPEDSSECLHPFSIHAFSSLGRNLMGIDPWPILESNR